MQRRVRPNLGLRNRCAHPLPRTVLSDSLPSLDPGSDLVGAEPAKRAASLDFGRVINAHHFQRVLGLLEAAKAAGGDVVYGGESDAAENYIAPTVVQNVPGDAGLLHDEIFGPVLPVVTYHTLNEAIAFINAREKPLSLYVFSRSASNIESILHRTSAGGTCVNETLLHYFNEYLPFGGAGHSEDTR